MYIKRIFQYSTCYDYSQSMGMKIQQLGEERCFWYVISYKSDNLKCDRSHRVWWYASAACMVYVYMSIGASCNESVFCSSELWNELFVVWIWGRFPQCAAQRPKTAANVLLKSTILKTLYAAWITKMINSILWVTIISCIVGSELLVTGFNIPSSNFHHCMSTNN